MFSKIKSLIKDGKNNKEEEFKGKITQQPKGIPISQNDFQFNYLTPNLTEYKIPNINTVYYLPAFISEESEQKLLDCIYSHENNLRWVTLKYSSRKLQKYGGEVTENGLINQECLPNFLQIIANYLTTNNIFPPTEETNKKLQLNHGLVNEYMNGVGIMPHTDGPLYYPFVIILSLGSHCCFNFYKDYVQYKLEEPLSKLLIEPRSLLIFTEECYEKYLHSIEDRTSDYIFMKFDKDGKNLKESNIDNIVLTDLWKKLAESKENQELIEKNIPRSKRISLTIRHVPTN